MNWKKRVNFAIAQYSYRLLFLFYVDLILSNSSRLKLKLPKVIDVESNIRANLCKYPDCIGGKSNNWATVISHAYNAS